MDHLCGVTQGIVNDSTEGDFKYSQYVNKQYEGRVCSHFLQWFAENRGKKQKFLSCSLHLALETQMHCICVHERGFSTPNFPLSCLSSITPVSFQNWLGVKTKKETCRWKWRHGEAESVEPLVSIYATAKENRGLESRTFSWQSTEAKVLLNRLAPFFPATRARLIYSHTLWLPVLWKSIFKSKITCRFATYHGRCSGLCGGRNAI